MHQALACQTSKMGSSGTGTQLLGSELLASQLLASQLLGSELLGSELLGSQTPNLCVVAQRSIRGHVCSYICAVFMLDNTSTVRRKATRVSNRQPRS